MNILLLIFCVIPAIKPITISPNGNSPEIKMIGGMMVEEGFVPMKLETTTNGNNMKSRKLDANSTKLSINERYRRLIPYMTFYYANDNTPITEAYNKDVEVEKAEIVEQKTIEQSQRQPKKIIYAPQRTIPRYQGNRLTQFNIASSNPTKVYYKEEPYYQTPHKFSTNFNPILSEHVSNVGFDHGRFVQKYNIVKAPSVPFTTTTRKPYLNLHGVDDDTGSVQYYVGKNEQLKYKLVPYEQTPVKILPSSENVYVPKKPIPVPVLVHKEPVYIKPRPVRPLYTYDNIQRLVPRKPVVVSENFYEKHRPQLSLIQSVTQPIIESGFKPIANPVQSTENPHLIPTTILPPSPVPQFEINEKPTEDVELDTVPAAPQISYRPDYYQYVVNKPTFEPEQHVTSKSTLSDLLNSLQLNKSIPKPITRENVGTSIRTLLQVLNALKAMQQNDVDTPILSTPKPFIVQEAAIAVTIKPEIESTPTSTEVDPELHEEPYLAHVNTPSQHLDDFPTHGSSSQRFPLPVQSDEEGGTPGRPGVDYPVLTTIPPTSFNCKTQRYKGFFADPETRCQVWHYCDLNGGQASFLCPNGTIFSQAGLTCDWWFNVRCASTTQLYVLNESLYKYILPHSPKFPEDYSGPLVDKYLTLKFKEMEEQFRKNKNKQNAKEKIDTDEDGSSEETTDTAIDKQDSDEKDEGSSVSEPSVLIESPGTSGNVQRLQD